MERGVHQIMTLYKHNSWIILDSLSDIVLANVEGCIVEIGVGQSTTILSQYAKKYNRRHYAVDKSDQACKRIKTEVFSNTAIYQVNSLDFMKTFYEPIALFLLDGSHKYHVIKQEAQFFIGKLVPAGGIGFLHDTYISEKRYETYKAKGKTTEAYKVRMELEKRDDISTFTWPYTCGDFGLTMIMKKGKNRPFYQQ